jgi:Holliday junction resolvase RusA-like endonuclease
MKPLTIWGIIPPKKTSQMINRRGSKVWISPNIKYKEWENRAAQELMIQKSEMNIKIFTADINLKVYIFRKGYKLFDLSNAIQSIEDALQKAKIIKNDSIIYSFDGSRKISGANFNGAVIWIEYLLGTDFLKNHVSDMYKWI